MEVSENNLIILSDYLSKTLNSDVNIRRPAEQFLQSLERNKNYALLLLKVIEKDTFDKTIRISASVVFKNFIKRNWEIEENDDKIFVEDREEIKNHIINLMLCSPESIQKQLSDAVSIIGKYDFPDKWPRLLDEMIQKFNTGNFNIINGALRTAHSLFKKYRYEFKSQKLWSEIKFVLDTFAKPLTDLFVVTMEVAKSQESPEVLAVVYNSLFFISKIFYSLNFQDLPEFFEDNMATWMSNFRILLNKQILIGSSDTDDDAGIIEQLRSQICENLVMYAQKYDEEFSEYLPGFVDDVWNLLTSIGPQQKYDILVSNALTFLSTVAEKKQYQNLFEDPKVLKSICEKVVFPNIEFRTCDEELFEDNPDEYIRRDIEGSDVDTRRRAACDLVKVLAEYFEPKIKDFFVNYINNMLNIYELNSCNWKSKNAAIFVVTSLVVKGQTEKYGVTQISNLVNLPEFTSQYIIPELEKQNINELPVIKADCIRYIMTFRMILPYQIVIGNLPTLTKFLKADSKVIHTYAAVCIEKILLIKDPASQKPIINAEDLVQIAEPILDGLFNILSKVGSEENEYAMKTILRTIVCLNEKSVPFLEKILSQLIIKLEKAAKNPSNPHYNHALFETVALSIKIVCSITASTVESFESALFPVLGVILQQDVSEFMPYVFQLISLLLEFRVKDQPLPSFYMELYQFLFTPVLWERNGNIHPLVRLLTAYINKTNPSEIESKLQVMSLLGVFQKLIFNKNNDHEGFLLLRTLIENCPNEVLAANRKSIFIILFQRLSTSKTVEYIKGLTVFLSFCIIIYGISDLVELINSLQANMFPSVLEKVILHEKAICTGTIEKKIIVVGLTKMLFDFEELFEGLLARFWPPLLKQIIRTFSVSEQIKKLVEDVNFNQIISNGGYEVIYSKLTYASRPEYDPVQGKGIGDVGKFFADSFLSFSNKNSARVSAIVTNTLDVEEQEILKNLLNSKATVKLY